MELYPRNYFPSAQLGAKKDFCSNLFVLYTSSVDISAHLSQPSTLSLNLNIFYGHPQSLIEKLKFCQFSE